MLQVAWRLSRRRTTHCVVVLASVCYLDPDKSNSMPNKTRRASCTCTPDAVSH